MSRLAVAFAAQVPVQPDRGRARDWAVQELSRREYEEARPGLVERALRRLWEWLNGIDLGVGAPPALGVAVIVLLIAAVLGYALYRSGGLHGQSRRRVVPVLSGPARTAADHRTAARQLASAQEWDQAVVEWFRAIARELEERALVSPQPGRTALEVAREGGAALPALAPDLLTAARYFDDVSYGRLTVGPPAEGALRELDDRLRVTSDVAVR